MAKLANLPATCQGCGRTGVVRGQAKPRWCRCRKNFGPLVAPKGYVAVFVYGGPSK